MTATTGAPRNIFDVRDGDEMQTVYVPGTPYFVRFRLDIDGGNFADVLRSTGTVDAYLTHDLMQAFMGHAKDAASAHEMGRWLQGRWEETKKPGG